MNGMWLLLVALSVSAKELKLASTRDQAVMLELFTSEGCISCPPADAWLGGFRQHPKLWKGVVPMAFHVDYWDARGWKDPFASPNFTLRQRSYGFANQIQSIYTPAFFRNGKEWHRNEQSLFGAKLTAGVLKAEQKKGFNFAVRYEPTEMDGAWTAHGVVLGHGLVSSVVAGENKGTTLKHDFVVLVESNRVMKKNGKVFETELNLALPSEVHREGTPPPPKPDSWSVAFWVRSINSTVPVQAIGGDWQPPIQGEKK